MRDIRKEKEKDEILVLQEYAAMMLEIMLQPFVRVLSKMFGILGWSTPERKDII